MLTVGVANVAGSSSLLMCYEMARGSSGSTAFTLSAKIASPKSTLLATLSRRARLLIPWRS